MVSLINAITSLAAFTTLTAIPAPPTAFAIGPDGDTELTLAPPPVPARDGSGGARSSGVTGSKKGRDRFTR